MNTTIYVVEDPNGDSPIVRRLANEDEVQRRQASVRDPRSWLVLRGADAAREALNEGIVRGAAESRLRELLIEDHVIAPEDDRDETADA